MDHAQGLVDYDSAAVCEMVCKNARRARFPCTHKGVTGEKRQQKKSKKSKGKKTKKSQEVVAEVQSDNESSASPLLVPLPPPPPPPTPMRSRGNKNNLLGTRQRQRLMWVIWCPDCILQLCTAVPIAWDCCWESRFQCVRGIPTWI